MAAGKAEPEVEIQWTDTDACLHLHCSCGAETHSDTPNIETIVCRACGREWELLKVMTPTEKQRG